MLRPIKDTILFIFADGVDAHGNGFTNKTDSGIVFKSFDHDAKSPRWAKVVAVGPAVEEILPGMTVLIEALRWTEGFTYDGVKIWKTKESEIMAVKE